MKIGNRARKKMVIFLLNISLTFDIRIEKDKNIS